MSRVWKRFFYKVGYASLFVTYVLSALFVPEVISITFFGQEPGLGVIIGSLLFLAIPGIGFILRDVYRESKREVEYENKNLMRNLGDTR